MGLAMLSRGDPTDGEWAVLDPLLPVSNNRCGAGGAITERLLRHVQSAVDAAEGGIDGNINVELKQFRAVATRYDKRGYVYLGTVTAAALLIWLRS